MFSQTRSWDSNAMAQRLQARKRSKEVRRKASAAGPAAAPAPGPRPEPPVLQQQPPPIPELPEESDQESGNLTFTPPTPISIDTLPSTESPEARASRQVPGPHQRVLGKFDRRNADKSSRYARADACGPGLRRTAEQQIRHNRVSRDVLTHEDTQRNFMGGRDRPLSAETGARAGQQRGSHGWAGETDASGSRMEGRNSAALRSDAGSSTVQAGVSCDWCYRDLSDQARHHCPDCPFNLCSVCIFNKKVIFPEHGRGHKSEELQPGSEPTDRTRSDTAAVLVCTLCGVELADTWYECEQCEDVVLCEDDRKLHVADHPLRAVSSKPGRDAHSAAPSRQTRSSSRAFGRRSAGSPDQVTDSPGAGSDEDGEGGLEHTDGDTPGYDSQVHAGSEEIVISEDEEESDQEAAPSSSRMSSLRPRSTTAVTPQQAPQHGSDNITLVLPREGYAVFAAWARAILDQAPPEAASSTRSANKRGRWSSRDRRRLERLMAQGKTDEEAGRVLGRSPGAVAQQWRKQKGH